MTYQQNGVIATTIVSYGGDHNVTLPVHRYGDNNVIAKFYIYV